MSNDYDLDEAIRQSLLAEIEQKREEEMIREILRISEEEERARKIEADRILAEKAEAIRRQREQEKKLKFKEDDDFARAIQESLKESKFQDHRQVFDKHNSKLDLNTDLDSKESTELWSVLFIRNYNIQWDKQKLIEVFSKYGRVNRIDIRRDRTSQDPLGVATIDYFDGSNMIAAHASAEEAVKTLNNFRYRDSQGVPQVMQVSRFFKQNLQKHSVNKSPTQSNLSLPINDKTNGDMDKDDTLEEVLKLSLDEHNKWLQNRPPHQHLWEELAGVNTRRFRSFIEVPSESCGLVVGSQHKHTRQIAEEAGGNCVIKTLWNKSKASLGKFNNDNILMKSSLFGDTTSKIPACLVIQADTEMAINFAEDALTRRMTDLFMSKKEVLSEHMKARNNAIVSSSKVGREIVNLVPEKRRHIFVDNSNIFINAMKLPGAENKLIRIDATKLSDILRHNNAPGTRIVAGSKPPANGGVWQHWENANFRVKVCSRDVDTHAEDLVDDFLHAQILNEITIRDGDIPGENTLVLATGDGNDNHGFANFVGVARAAANRGWRVEIWGWQHSMSGRFKSLADEFKDKRISIHYLHHFVNEITFVSKMRPHVIKDNSGDTVSDKSGTKQADLQETQDEDDENYCVVCLDAPREHAVKPCFHLCLCTLCASLIKDLCPCCQGRFEGTVRIYNP